MSENSEHSEHHDDGHHVDYRKIYFTLLVLLVVSVVGPFFGVLWVTLITAFGIAVVKANLVIQNFMHLKWEKRIMKWVLATSLILMGLMFAGISPDVMNHEGNNWENVAAAAAVERGIEGGEVEEAEVEFVPVERTVAQDFNLVCATCHGAEGRGDGAAGAALDCPPADFTTPEFWAERDMDRIVTVIRDGAAAVGGCQLMVGWSASFSAERIQELADHVATFRPEG